MLIASRISVIRADWARHQIVNCLLKAGKPEEALKETARLMAIVPDDPDVFRLRSSIYTGSSKIILLL
jgi:regulator of sirC expression with transglutaminase-like and TPR domain